MTESRNAMHGKFESYRAKKKLNLFSMVSYFQTFSDNLF